MNFVVPSVEPSFEVQSYIMRSKKAANYLRLMTHSQLCKGSCKEAICRQTCQILYHSRFCGIDDCQFKGCETTKKLLQHVTDCKGKRNCLICSLAASNAAGEDQVIRETLSRAQEARKRQARYCLTNHIPFKISPSSTDSSIEDEDGYGGMQTDSDEESCDSSFSSSGHSSSTSTSASLVNTPEHSLAPVGGTRRRSGTLIEDCSNMHNPKRIQRHEDYRRDVRAGGISPVTSCSENLAQVHLTNNNHLVEHLGESSFTLDHSSNNSSDDVLPQHHYHVEKWKCVNAIDGRGRVIPSS
jgi:hypothetical protein